MFKGKTLGEALTTLGGEIKESVLLATEPEAIDWSNVKSMLSSLLEQFGPVLISIFVGMLAPKK